MNPILILLAGFWMLMTINPASASIDNWRTDHYRQMIIHEAHANDISPALMLAVAEIESAFDPYAVSRKGARGIMQIMPATAKGLGVPPDRLYNPQINIELGTRFLADLLTKYDGREDIALSHYNGGSRVNQNGRLRVIPATRDYVRKVKQKKRYYERWLARHNNVEPIDDFMPGGPLYRYKPRTNYSRLMDAYSDTIASLKKLEKDNWSRSHDAWQW